jgi:protein involved in polysaccharide export with SLBB domain
VIKISSDLHEWENTPADVELRPGDELVIPKRPNFVLVNGQVYSPSAITFAPGKTVEWYLRQAGGPTEFANRKNIFVIRANGSVLAGEEGHGFWTRSVLGASLKPGDTIVVPEKIVAASTVWKNLLNTAQFTSSLALAARVVTSF